MLSVSDTAMHFQVSSIKNVTAISVHNVSICDNNKFHFNIPLYEAVPTLTTRQIKLLVPCLDRSETASEKQSPL